MSPAACVAVGAVRAYQWTIRPLIGANCRFYPSCSEYAVEAFQVHGAMRGGALAGWRILRCNPWCNCGYDPVPPRLECRGAMGETADGSSLRTQTEPAIPQPAGEASGTDDGKSY